MLTHSVPSNGHAGRARPVRRRGVAQLGSAPALGAGCRRFKSCHPDQPVLRLDQSKMGDGRRTVPMGVPTCPRIDRGSACSTAVTRPACLCPPAPPRRPSVPDDAGQPSVRGVPHVKSTVEKLNPTRVKLTVEVPFDELKPNFDRAYKALAGQVNIPGFRRGKVPAKILDARLGRGTILTEVVNEAVPAKFREAATEAKLETIGQPDIEVTRIDDGDALAFTAEVDVRPEITLPAIGDIAVTVDDVEVTEADIDEQGDALRERFATTTAVERPAAAGDSVSIDLTATVDGEVLDDATTEGLSYRVGAGDLVDGIDEAITGLSAGES